MKDIVDLCIHKKLSIEYLEKISNEYIWNEDLTSHDRMAYIERGLIDEETICELYEEEKIIDSDLKKLVKMGFLDLGSTIKARYPHWQRVS